MTINQNNKEQQRIIIKNNKNQTNKKGRKTTIYKPIKFINKLNKPPIK